MQALKFSVSRPSDPFWLLPVLFSLTNLLPSLQWECCHRCWPEARFREDEKHYNLSSSRVLPHPRFLLSFSHNIHCHCVSPVHTPWIIKDLHILPWPFVAWVFLNLRKRTCGSERLIDFPCPVSPQCQTQAWTSILDPDSPCFCRPLF
jgi:hypothetical protein